MTNRREFLQSTLGLPFVSGAFSLGPDRLHAQEPWPTRTITLVVPFPPGGTADFAGRPLAAHLADKLGQNVVVENKGGAGGGIGQPAALVLEFDQPWAHGAANPACVRDRRADLSGRCHGS